MNVKEFGLMYAILTGHLKNIYLVREWLKGRYLWNEPVVDGRIMLERMYSVLFGRVWTILVWFIIVSSGRLLCRLH